MSAYTNQTTAEQVAEDCRAQIANKTVLITGATPGGLGATFGIIIAQYSPAAIILATRDMTKAQETAKEINAAGPGVRVHCVELDLQSLSQVRKAAEKINSLSETIDVIVNNAGVMATPFSKTADGIETQFGINHVGHFLLTNLLLPKILARNVPVRVVNVTSNGYRFHHVRLEDWNFEDGKQYHRWLGYGQSKSANMLFSVALAQKLGKRKLVSVSLHPGIITSTGLTRALVWEDFQENGVIDRALGLKRYWDQPFAFKTPSQGVATHVFAAFHPSLDASDANGSYLMDSQIVEPQTIQCWGRDPIDAESLWKLSEELVEQKFEF
ncbi:short-chain dehydrogenase [Xylaria arbuscula]|nr:short-chain dehydrogenase [Xylaria arbuscula]